MDRPLCLWYVCFGLVWFGCRHQFLLIEPVFFESFRRVYMFFVFSVSMLFFFRFVFRIKIKHNTRTYDYRVFYFLSSLSHCTFWLTRFDLKEEKFVNIFKWIFVNNIRFSFFAAWSVGCCWWCVYNWNSVQTVI